MTGGKRLNFFKNRKSKKRKYNIFIFEFERFGRAKKKSLKKQNEYI